MSPVVVMCGQIQQLPCLVQRFAEVGGNQQFHCHVVELIGHILSAVDVQLNDLLGGLVAGHIENVHRVIKEHHNIVRDVDEHFMGLVHATSGCSHRDIVEFKGPVQKAFDGSVQGRIRGDVMNGQADVDRVVKRWKQPF